MTVVAPRPALDPAIRAQVDAACAHIAPAWPLDRLIAVNPYWGWTDRPIAEVAAAIGATAAVPMLMPRAWYRAQRDAGRIPDAAIERAIERHAAPTTRADVLAAIEHAPPPLPQHPLVSALCDAARQASADDSWRECIAQQLGQACESYFDAAQVPWAAAAPDGLYAAWRESLRTDRSSHPFLAAHDLRAAADELPDSADELIATALDALALPRTAHTTYLTAALLSIVGWASAAAHRRWEARLRGGDDDTIVELLAARLGWELLLYRTAPSSDLPTRWAQARRQWKADAERVAREQAPEWILQRAFELHYHEGLATDLARHSRLRQAERGRSAPPAPSAQAVFCIDVRSEAFRRHLEGCDHSIHTLGFAGSFGLPLEYQPGVGKARLQLPGLLAPAFVAEDGGDGVPTLTRRRDGTAIDAESKADLAANLLRGMSLTQDFAPLVALLGHAALLVNNPQAAGLACGACGGNSGEVNARVAAALLNDADVRQRLAARGLAIPARTRFVGGVHDTCTDDVAIYPDATTSATHAEVLGALQAASARAARRTRVERAGRLGIDAEDPLVLAEALRARAADRSEVRPEWGLAGNAAFIVAPRGRAFLHEYDERLDPQHRTLEVILTAPVVVGHWINFQYWASTVDPHRFGSGDKTRHRVAGENLGVYEGTGGDLRIGLAQQAVHDGTRFVHDPMRLGVFVEAGAAAIDAVLAKHATIRQLVANEWIFLYRLDPATGAVEIRRPEGWLTIENGNAARW